MLKKHIKELTYIAMVMGYYHSCSKSYLIKACVKSKTELYCVSIKAENTAISTDS